MWAVHASRLEPEGRVRNRVRARDAIAKRIMELEAPAGFAERLPEDLVRTAVDRWFFDEVVCLFRWPGEDQGARVAPKLRWFVMEQSAASAMGLPDLANCRLGSIIARRGTFHAIGPAAVRIHVLLSTAGLQLVIVEVQLRDLPLAAAMRATYYAAHPDAAPYALVIYPNTLHDQVRDGERMPAGVAAAALTCCVGEMFFEGLQFRGSLPTTVAKMFADAIGKTTAQPSFRGRIPLATSYVLPAGNGDLGEVEGLVARCLRHPAETQIAPPAVELLEGMHFRKLHIDRDRRFYVSSDSFVAIACAATGFTRSQWPDRVAREYLLTWLIALHQLLVCQDLSWQSYTSGGVRDNERLMKLFQRYQTDFEFSSISGQMNVQRLYHAAREVLGVERFVEDVRKEVSTWLDGEMRHEQRSLNSIAVVIFLAGMATLLINLNLAFFNSDAEIDALALRPGNWTGLWFWIPLAAAALLAIGSSRMREHLRRVVALLVGPRQD